MRHHIDVLGLLHMVWGVFASLSGLSLAILALGTHTALTLGGSIGAAPRAAIWLMAVSATVMIAFGVACFRIGRRVRRLDPGARHVAIGLAIPNLLVIPFGTGLGVYTFWVLLNNDAREMFGRPARGPVA